MVTKHTYALTVYQDAAARRLRLIAWTARLEG
jgi:hypothetical protein